MILRLNFSWLFIGIVIIGNIAVFYLLSNNIKVYAKTVSTDRDELYESLE